MTHEEMIEVINGHKQGKPVQRKYRIGSGYVWEDIEEPNWNFRDYDYRLKPEPKKLPLGPEDFPPGTVLRHKTWAKESWSSLEGVRLDKVLFGGMCLIYADVTLLEWLRRLPNTTEWLPCYKKE